MRHCKNTQMINLSHFGLGRLVKRSLLSIQTSRSRLERHLLSLSQMLILTHSLALMIASLDSRDLRKAIISLEPCS